MVEYVDDLHTLYWEGDYREFLNRILKAPTHSIPNRLYDEVRTLRDDKRQPDDIRLLASEILGE